MTTVPAAIGDLVNGVSGIPGPGALLSLGLYFFMLAWLFDLDPLEVGTTALAIFLLRMAVVVTLVLAILREPVTRIASAAAAGDPAPSPAASRRASGRSAGR